MYAKIEANLHALKSTIVVALHVFHFVVKSLKNCFLHFEIDDYFCSQVTMERRKLRLVSVKSNDKFLEFRHSVS